MYAMPLPPEERMLPEADSAGVAIRQRMSDLRLSQADLAQRLGMSQGWVSQYLFRDTQRTVRRMLVDTPDMLERLARTLDWRVETLLSEANIAIPGASVTAQEMRSTSRTVPAYRLIVAQGKGDVVEHDRPVYFDEDREGDFEAYVLRPADKPRTVTTVIIQRQVEASEGDEIVCEDPARGVIVASIVDLIGDTYLLENDALGRFLATGISIRGVVVRKQEDREPKG